MIKKIFILVFAGLLLTAPVAQSAPEEYLIITPPHFVATLMPLINARESDGLEVNFYPLNLVESNFSGRDIQEKIRNCIKLRYKYNNTRWVLLVGDIDADDNPGEGATLNPTVLDKEWEMPIRYVYHPTDDYDYIPTDLYYSGLDGSWDEDNDGRFGEKKSDCDLNVDEVDWIPEVNIGRLPVQTTEQLANILAKIINCDFEDYTFDQMKVLQINSRLEDFSDSSIDGKILATVAGYDPPTKANITGEMRTGAYPLVTFTGHATENGWSASDGLWTAESLNGEQPNYVSYAIVDNWHWLAQSFRADCAQIKKVEIFIWATQDNGQALQDLVVSIRSSLDGTNLTGGSLPSSEATVGFHSIDVPDIAVTPGNTYYLVVDSPNTGVDDFVFYRIGIGGNDYDGGTAYKQSTSSGWEEQAYDLTFKICDTSAMLFFNYIAACSSANIDHSNSQLTIAEELLFKKSFGSVGYIGAFRLSTPIGQNDLWKEFWKAFIEESVTRTGEAYARAQRRFYLNWGYSINSFYDYWRFTGLIYNLLGDPYLKIGSVPTNGPRIEAVPNGIMAAETRPYIFDYDNTVEIMADGPIAFEKIAGPDDFSISSAGVISWMVPDDVGRQNISIRATDDNGWTELSWEQQPISYYDSSYFCINSQGNSDAYVGHPYDYDTDNIPDLDGPVSSDVTWKKLAGPKALSINRGTGVISWVPDNTGFYETLVSAYRGSYGLSFHQIRIQVSQEWYADDDVDGEDLATFINYYSSSDPAADLNGDEVVDTADLEMFAEIFGNYSSP